MKIKPAWMSGSPENKYIRLLYMPMLCQFRVVCNLGRLKPWIKIFVAVCLVFPKFQIKLLFC